MPIATIPVAGADQDQELTPEVSTQPTPPAAGSSPPAEQDGVSAAQPADLEGRGSPDSELLSTETVVPPSPRAAPARPSPGRGATQPPRARPQPTPPAAEGDVDTLTRAEHEAEVERRVQQAQAALERKWDRRVQELVDRRAAEIVDDRLGQRAASQQEDRLWQAVQDNDYLTLAEAKKAELQAQRAARAAPAPAAPSAPAPLSPAPNGAAEVVLQVWSEQVDPLLHGLTRHLDQDARQAITAKQYGDDPVAAREAYLEDVLAAHAKRSVARARARWEKDELPAAVERRLTELDAAEPALDLGGGTPATNGELTPERYSEMSYEERRALKKSDPDAIEHMIAKYSGTT